MKATSIALITAALTLTPALVTAQSERFYDYAKVKRVTPIYQSFEHRIPRESCWTERVRVEEYRRGPRSGSTTGTLVGGVIGGALGHAVGRGSDNKKIGTVVGSALGMSIGNDVSRRRQSQYYDDYPDVSYEDEQRCETTYSTEREERLSGYDVTYKYRGETFTTFMQEHPGDRLRVSVSVSPID